MVGLHIHRPKDDIYTCIYIRILQRSSVLLLGSPTLKKGQNFSVQNGDIYSIKSIMGMSNEYHRNLRTKRRYRFVQNISKLTIFNCKI